MLIIQSRTADFLRSFERRFLILALVHYHCSAFLTSPVASFASSLFIDQVLLVFVLAYFGETFQLTFPFDFLG